MPEGVAWVRWQGTEMMQFPVEDQHDRGFLKKICDFYIKTNASIFLLRMQM